MLEITQEQCAIIDYDPHDSINSTMDEYLPNDGMAYRNVVFVI